MTAANVGAIEGGGGLTLFGMTLTGKALGIIIGIAGLGLAGYVYINFTAPEQDKIPRLERQIAETQSAIDAQAGLVSRIAAKQEEKRQIESKGKFVLSLLPNQDSIDTLLIDLHKVIPRETRFTLANGVVLTIDSSLRGFTPALGSSTDLYDTYTFNINFDSTFPAAIETIQNLEKLQSFLVIRDVKLTKGAITDAELRFPEGFEVSPEDKFKIIQNLPPKVSVSFKLEAYVPKTGDAPAAPAQ
ncbi:MAG: hypothetical protein ACK4QL_06425 [Pseudanabaenaceae cyanobacterium]